MIRFTLLSMCVIAVLHASPLKTLERQKRAYAIMTEWSWNVDEVAPFYGVSTCSDLEPLSAYREDDIKDEMLKQHIQARKRWNEDVTAKGCPDKSISEAMKWDSDLAALAQLWANMCTWGHGYLQTRCSFDENMYGQNVFWSAVEYDYAHDTMLMETVHDWEEVEKPYLDQCTGECDESGVGTCGHYEQLVAPYISRVGCAYTDDCHKCTKIYYQDDEIDGPVDTQYELYYGEFWPTYQAMYVCVYA